MKTRIVFTGGGSAGHVTPNVALIELAQKEAWHVDYIGGHGSVEERIIGELNVPFYSISSGKLRRYFSWKNFIDPFRILLGIHQAYWLLRKLQTDVVFSKGGFVAFPVVIAAWLNRIPIVAHESDMSPGLANRLCFPFVNKICLSFDAAKKHFKKTARVEVTGTPIRSALFKGDKTQGLQYCGFNADKPCLLVMGGSLGASGLNQVIREALPQLTRHYQVIHLCGKGKKDEGFQKVPAYCQIEYASQILPDLLAAADIIVSRAGANALYEILALQKPHVLIPLSAKVSRGDQIQNARFFRQQGISFVIDDDKLRVDVLLNALEEVALHHDDMIQKMQSLNIESAAEKIIEIIQSTQTNAFCEGKSDAKS